MNLWTWLWTKNISFYHFHRFKICNTNFASSNDMLLKFKWILHTLQCSLIYAIFSLVTLHAINLLTISCNVICSEKSRCGNRKICSKFNSHYGSSWNSNNCFSGQIPATNPHFVGRCISVLDLKMENNVFFHHLSYRDGSLLLLFQDFKKIQLTK